MKILMVAIPNHHFFQWVNQLKDCGYEVFWFDITDGGPKSLKIDWVTQFKGWKLKWDFPFRSRLKKKTPKLYNSLQKFNERKVNLVFQKIIDTIKPDIVHCFEMQLAGLPILSVMQKNKIPFIYSSWGSDLFYSEKMAISKREIKSFLNRTNFLITDCKRDYTIAKKKGFNAKYLGVFPGNGGLTIEKSKIKAASKRETILIKGYDDGVGKASVVLKAIALISEPLLKDKNIVIYSADDGLENQINNSNTLSNLKISLHSRYTFIPNQTLLEIMGNSCIHIANSISDGMPNALLEAMSMGAFPIQSNPGKVTEEVITHSKNGLLVENPLDENEIANHITVALNNNELRTEAQDFNTSFIENNYNRMALQPKIEELYQYVFNFNSL